MKKKSIQSAKSIQIIKRLANDGVGYEAIAEELNEQGFVNSRGDAIQGYSVRWFCEKNGYGKFKRRKKTVKSKLNKVVDAPLFSVHNNPYVGKTKEENERIILDVLKSNLDLDTKLKLTGELLQ